jgi:hypothetical protein
MMSVRSRLPPVRDSGVVVTPMISNHKSRVRFSAIVVCPCNSMVECQFEALKIRVRFTARTLEVIV